MKPRSARVRWSVVAVLPAVVLFLAGLARPQVFDLIGVATFEPVFSDLVALLAAGEAHQAGIDIWRINPLDPHNRPHVYGAAWLVTGSLGLVRADAAWLGLMLAAVFVATAAVVLGPRRPSSAIAAAALFAAPGVLLAMERGNNDVVVFLLIAAAAWLVSRSGPGAGGLGAALIPLGMALKLYPLVCIPLMAARDGARRMAWILCGVAAGLCAAVGILFWSDFVRVAGIAPAPFTIFSYGFKLGYYVLWLVPAERFWVLLGASPVLWLAASVAWRHRAALLESVPQSGFTAACAVGGGCAWVFCYFATTNYPYRAILLLLPARLWLALMENDRTRDLGRLLAWGAALYLWATWWKDGFHVLDAAGNVQGPHLFWIVLGFDLALGLALTLLLAAQLAGWAWRRLVSRGASAGG